MWVRSLRLGEEQMKNSCLGEVAQVREEQTKNSCLGEVAQVG